MATIGKGKLVKQAYVMRSTSPREAAELAYVLAVLAKERGDIVEAQRYAEESIQLLDGLHVDSLEDCAGQYTTIEGVPVPSIMHSDVVRQWIKNL